MNLGKFGVNSLKLDDFGRPHGLLLIDKVVGVTSHSIVYQIRKRLLTKQVGHAGALDPFAEGLLIILVGKATKLSDEFLNLDKEYTARILLGINTNSGDTEGEVTNYKKLPNLNITKIKEVLNSFTGEIYQYVPVLSSVKVKGEKLRVLARKYDNFELEDLAEKRVAKFYENNELKKEVILPAKNIKIHSLELLKDGQCTTGKDENLVNSIRCKNKIYLPAKIFNELENKIQYIDIKVHCSKGTYIRQLAIDIGLALSKTFGYEIPTMLIKLKRTKIGPFYLEDAKCIEDI